MPPESEYPQDRGVGDQLHALAKAGVEGVPFVGGLLSEMIQQIWIPTLQRRQVEWLNGVAEELDRLAGDVSSIHEHLASDEFLDLFLEALRSAQRTHEAEKREALRNAVVNAAVDPGEDQVWRLIFVSRLDELHPAHLQLLRFLRSPREGLIDRGVEPPSLLGGGRSHLVELAFPEWTREFYDQLYADLAGMSLLHSGGLHAMVTGSGVYESILTDQGQRFLDFISEPPNG